MDICKMLNRQDIRAFFGMVIIFLWISCNPEEEPFSTGRPDAKIWTVGLENVIDAGVGKDGIPSIDQPRFSDVQDVNPAFDDALVLGIVYQGKAKAYPMPMLDWHEIVNDDINGLPIAITYCPLTGTGVGWSREINGAVTTFGVSGLLFNSNLMPYDRLTNSTWSQQKLECVNGLFIGEQPGTHTLVETTFRTWRQAFPDSEVMNANTGFIRRYSEYPYGTYRTNHEQLFFPIVHEDDRLPKKERLLGVFEGQDVVAFRFNQPGDPLEIFPQIVGEKQVMVVRSHDLQILSAFYPGNRQITPIEDGWPAIMMDQLGNTYDLSGRVLDGPAKGSRLEQPLSFMGFWFSWAAFYPNIKLAAQ